jgi:hypothetical protein
MVDKSPSYGVVKIILQKTGYSDDVLTLSPNTDDEHYSAQFVQSSVNNTAVGVVRANEVFDYLEYFIRTAVIDAEGPDYFQFDIPLYPSVIVKKENVQDYLGLLFDQIRSIERNWPFERSGIHV